MEIDEIFKYLSPITVGFIAAYLGSRIAIDKFKKEKLWDERRLIYREIIEAFEEIEFWSEYVRASHCCEPVIESETKFDESLRVIAKHSATGGLFISNEFLNNLREANTKLSQTIFKIDEESLPDRDTAQGRSKWMFILSNEIRSIINDYLPKLISIANKEMPK